MTSRLQQAVEVTISKAFDNHFAQSARYIDALNILNEIYFLPHNLHIQPHPYNGLFAVIIDTHSGRRDDMHEFPTFAQAFDFAMKTYTEKITSS